MTGDPIEIDLDEARRWWEVVWPIVGYDLPTDVHRRIRDANQCVGEPETWSEETRRRMKFFIYVRDGIAAAYYHRDRIEAIEREIVSSIRTHFSAGREGRTSSTATPQLSFEYIAYLNAARRTLDYVARAVSVCFGRSGGSIRVTAKDVSGREPRDVSDAVVALTQEVVSRFPYLLTEKGEGKAKSARDRAAHREPVEPAYLFVMFWHGKVGIELHAGNAGPLEAYNTLDIERMTADEPRLTKSLDAELSDLVDFCVELLELAAQAEAHRIAKT